MGPRYLITGGAGFVGSHLVDRLGADGARAVVVDDGSAGTLTSFRARIAGTGVELHPVAVEAAGRSGLLQQLVQDVDAVLHLAAIVGPRRVLAEPRACIERNHAAAAAVLTAAAAARKPVLIASSSEVYGRGAQLPFREDADLQLGSPQHPRWAYAVGKALIECLALAHAREQELPVVVARIFNTVGPRQSSSYGLVLPTFVQQALRQEPLTVHGDGQQTRCFTHVRDTVDALLALLHNPAAHGQIVNVGSDEEVSVVALAELVRSCARSRSALRFLPVAEAAALGYDELPRRQPDLTKLAALAGRVPRIRLPQIVADVVAAMGGRPAPAAAATTEAGG